MSISRDPGLVDKTTRTLQIIISALASGPIVLLLVVFLAIPPSKPPSPPAGAAGLDEPLPVLTVVAFTFAVILGPLSLVVPRLVSDSWRKRIAEGKWSLGPSGPHPASTPATDPEKLAVAYQTQKIIGAALNEGAAFLAVIAYMLERNPVALGLALALIVGVAARFPLRPAVEHWLDEQLAQLQVERRSAELA